MLNLLLFTGHVRMHTGNTPVSAYNPGLEKGTKEEHGGYA